MGFTFVNYVGDPSSADQKEDELPIIRSHVARELLRRRKAVSKPLERHNTRAQSRAMKFKDSGRSQAPTLARRFVYNDHARISHETNLLNELLPVELDRVVPKVRQHLHYFVYGFTPTTFPTTCIRHECDVLAIAVTSRAPALLHALCAVSAIHRALVHPCTSSPGLPPAALDYRSDASGLMSLRHKQCAINILQKSIAGAARSQIPSLQATIILLLTAESLCGDEFTTKTHKSGLLELVRHGEGTTQPVPALMFADVIMSDIKSAASSLTKPLIAPMGQWTNTLDKFKHLAFTPHRPDLTCLGSGFLVLEAHRRSEGGGRDSGGGLDPHLTQLLHAMRHLINAREQDSDLGMGTSGVDGRHFLILEHELLSLPFPRVRSHHDHDHDQDHGPDPKSIVTQPTLIAECARLAALLYCNLCLWTWPRTSTLITTLSRSLRRALVAWAAATTTTPHSHSPSNSTSLSPSPYDPAHLPLILWANFIGGFAATAPDETRWYIKGVIAVSRAIGGIIDDDGDRGGGRESLRALLSSFFYVDRLMGSYLAVCWEEMVRVL